MLYYAIQIIISLIAGRLYSNNRLRYFTLITVGYFISYYSSGSFDVSLTLYCVFALLGMGKPTRFALSDIFFGIWIIVYFLVGVWFQDSFSTMSTLVTRYGFIVVWIYMNCIEIDSKEWIATTEDYRFAVIAGLVTEMIIAGLVWMTEGIGARVVTNNQPIGAGMVTALVAVVGWGYLTKKFSATEMLIYTVLFTIIVLFSGTRGYMVIIAFGLVVIMCAYLLDIPQHGKKLTHRIGVFLVLSAFIVLGILIIDKDVWVQLLRLDAGLGYRENENFFVREIMKVAPWYNKLFGFGFGGKANHLDDFLTVVHMSSWNRVWMSIKLLNKTIFHNYWYTAIFKQGFTGLAFIILFLIIQVVKMTKMRTNIWLRILLIMLVIGNMFSQTYRITATCSIYEILIIMYFVKQIENKNKIARRHLRRRSGSRKENYEKISAKR